MSSNRDLASALLPLASTKRKGLRNNHRGFNLICKTAALLGLVGIGLFMYYGHSSDDAVQGDHLSRRLGETGICRAKTTDERNDACPSPPPAYMIVPYLIGTLYIFWAIAIICDDFFVPALEVIGERLNIGDDIAGATLMAAGGSAPELATSLIGTFTGSDVGFGTIVGSAVFNVLFVIACCVAFTPEKFAPLELTWWPLARDCTYYIISLIILSLFFGWISPNEIELWEAIVLFLLYIGYCIIMYYNEELQERITGKKVVPEDSEAGSFSEKKALADAAEGPASASHDAAIAKNVEMTPSVANANVPAIKLAGSKSNGGSPKSTARGAAEGFTPRDPSKYVRRKSLYKASKFRAGLLKLATNPNMSLFDHAGMTVVYKLKGTVKELFDQLDTDKSGSLERNEVEVLVKFLFDGTATKITATQVDEIMKELDVQQNGAISLTDFTTWYLKSEKRLQFEERKVFDDLDTENVGSIGVADFEKLLHNLEVNVTDEEMKEAIKRITDVSVEDGNGVRRITFEQFRKWFEESEHWKKQKDMAEHVAEEATGVWGEITDFPKDNTFDNVMYLILVPIMWPLALTAGIKDNRVEGNGGWCYYQFLMSIAWISVYSFVMVDWITKIGLILHIPAVVMGLTLLAAGTSVPDLLSSIVVAKAGRGDMAVSSSIGSNIFDVTVGLPVPWILFNLILGCPVQVGADNLVLSVVILTLMVAAVVTTIMLSGWKMTKNLGIVMMVLYVIFLAQDVIRVFVASSMKC